ncbi:GrpB family protein [Saccharothrix carnea]|uniref:GrpB family protein n=1 Tax=Saccharothrix carnea TaxID=1280637 RepID=UPI00237966A1|nr:GrpB family protein [Saccharothrix sp. CB00851]
MGRMVAFRDRLRVSEADRVLYERTKRELAAREWEYLQQYADAKAEVVADIMGRA